MLFVRQRISAACGFGKPARALSTQGHSRRVRWAVLTLLLGSLVAVVCGAEILPPAPRDHFNDYAGIVSPGTARQLEAELTQFERDTTNQILVAIYPRMQSDSSIEDYTVRLAQSWKVGTAARKNGAVLFIFSEDRKLYISVGYGLEGVLPDATCKQIIANEITPRFRNGDFSGGVAAGVHAMLAATRGEYHGTGRTVKESQSGQKGGIGGFALIIIFLVIVLRSIFGRNRNVLYSRGGRRGMWVAPTVFGGGGGSWGGGGGGGGGSFSGGGGSFGGGGAGGNW